jgi:heptosyltransferase-2/heptosyltransferase-3
MPVGGPGAILVIRPDHLGDVLLSRPAIDRLAQTFPGARLVVAVGPWGRAALGAHPCFDVLTCRFPGFSRARTTRIGPYITLGRYAVRLRRYRFDAAIILRPDHWWGAWLTALAGIPVRIGYATPETSPFLTTAVPLAPGRHAVQESIDMVAAAITVLGRRPETDVVPALSMVSAASDDEAVATLLRECGIDGGGLVVLHPGAGSPLKAWPLERFATVGADLSARLGARLVVTGSAAEWPLAARLCAALPEGTLNLAGRLDWRMLEALLRRAALVVGIDSGPLHLAVAAGTPSIVLFGPADPVQFGPWGPPGRHRVIAADMPCRPCRRLDVCRLQPGSSAPPPCMRAIEPSAVVAATVDLLPGPRG